MLPRDAIVQRIAISNMIHPRFMHRFEGDSGVDVGTQEIDAVFPDGERRRIVLRVGAPFERGGKSHIRSELENLDRTDGPVFGVGSLDTLIAGITWIVERMKVFQKVHGCTYYWPDSEDIFDYIAVFSTVSRHRDPNEPGLSDEARFYALTHDSKEALASGKFSEAKAYAIELATLATQFKENWNYGNAIHNSSIILGQLALLSGRIDEAKKHLLAAGRIPGSPQLDTFGPDMRLAKDLLEVNEREIVLQYLELCRAFWKMHRGRLDEWSNQIQADKVPDFGASLR